MALEGRLELKLAQKLILTPQLQLAIKLLQLPQLELSQTLTQELTENPFLEEIIEERDDFTREERENIEEHEEHNDTEAPLEKMVSGLCDVDDYFDERGSDGRDLGYFTPGTVDQPSFEQFTSRTEDLYDHLTWQLRLSDATEEIRGIGEIVIGNIDESGYLTAMDEEIAQASGSEISAVRSAISLIQGFDPPGIAARNLAECLLLQLKAMDITEGLPCQLILNNMTDIERKRYQNIAKQYGVTLEEVMHAIQVIADLEPRPARNYSSVTPAYIVPDVIIVKSEAGYQIILNDEGLPRIRLNNYYKKLLLPKNALSQEEKQFIETKLRSAVWLLKSLDQRNKTIYRVTENILNFQMDFFEKGTPYLKPLNLRDVAASLGLHESTISRVTSNKYLSCSHGLFSFRYFFSSALHGASGSVSSTSVKDLLRTIISEEDPSKPFSDQKIVELMKTKNIEIARRTIAKYREELKIAPQGQRKVRII